jgi:hypothetical protein
MAAPDTHGPHTAPAPGSGPSNSANGSLVVDPSLSLDAGPGRSAAGHAGIVCTEDAKMSTRIGALSQRGASRTVASDGEAEAPDDHEQASIRFGDQYEVKTCCAGSRGIVRGVHLEQVVKCVGTRHQRSLR